MALPDNYKIVDKDGIKPEEVLEVRRSTGWGDGDSDEGWLGNLESSLAAVGVRESSSGVLVGVGFIVGNMRHAVLCDFNVRPEYQHKGIGTAILLERMRIAEDLEIPYLYTSLDEANPLVSLYKELGFASSGNVYFRNSTKKVKDPSEERSFK